MKKVISISLILVLIFPLLTSCVKEENSVVTPTNSENSLSEQKVWPWVIAGVVAVVGALSSGQVEAEYWPSGNIKKYKCSGIGTCHVVINNSNNKPLGETDEIFTYDFEFSGFEIVSSDRGDVFLRTSLDNPDMRKVFYDERVWDLSFPFIISDSETLEILKLDEPLRIEGEYVVMTDLDERLIYVQLK